MGLFNKVFKKEDENNEGQKKRAFTPITLKTDDVPRTLHEVASEYDVSPQMLDFRRIETRTFIKMDENSEWEELEEGEWEKFDTPEILLNPNFLVKQEHEIEIFLHKEEPWSKDLLLHVAANKERSRVVAAIKSGSVLRRSEGLAQKLQNLLINRLLRAKILVDLWESDAYDVFDELAAKALVDGKFVVGEEIRFDVARCYASKKPVDDALILHYKEKQKQDESGRIDYAKRGFIQAVEEGEVIIEYVKPRPGRPGRNCQGVYIPVEEPKESHKPDFGVSERIEVREEESRILYIAKQGGYVVFEEGRYDIREEMEIEEVSFKTTGSIDAGVETDVKIHVQEKDFLKEAIGTGVEVEATDIRVEGNVGASAVVRAEKVEIGGQTHQSSRIFAKEAKINVLRGFLKVEKSAEVNRIEGGELFAKEAKVEQMIGGEIRAMSADVALMVSNARIYAVEGVRIGQMQGENNKIIISAADIEAYHDEIVRLENRIEETEKELEKFAQKLKEKEALYEKSEHAVQTLKQKILADRKKGLPPKPAFVIKIKQFQKLTEQIEQMRSEMQAKSAELEAMRTKLLGFQDMVIHAVIRNEGEWGEYTTVEYRLLQPHINLEYRPKPGSGREEIYLKEVEDEGYVIMTRKIEA